MTENRLELIEMREFVLKNIKANHQEDYDVIVVGGGIAGIGAALAAKREGAKVLLIEKTITLGGLATAGLIVYYHSMCDGKGYKVIGGISEELLKLSIKYGYNTISKNCLDESGKERLTEERYNTLYNGSAFTMALDDLLVNEGIDLLFDTSFLTSIRTDGRCEKIIVYSKSGINSYGCKAVVDATGDAEVMHNMGATCTSGENINAQWAFTLDIDSLKDAVENDDVNKALKIFKLYVNNTINENGFNEKPLLEKYSQDDPKYITDFVIRSRSQLFDILKNTDYKKSCIATLPSIPLFRKIRRINGIYLLSDKDDNKFFNDSIGSTGHFCKIGHIYEIPFRSLISQGINNVIVAGRCISATGNAWEVTRVIPPAALTGQAAGTAAAIAAGRNMDIQDVNILELQDKLSNAGVIIHFDKK